MTLAPAKTRPGTRTSPEPDGRPDDTVPRLDGFADDPPAEAVVAEPTPASPTYTVGTLFSGMGGCLGGARRAGFKPLWASDIDSDCCATLRHRFPETHVVEKPIEELSVVGDGLEPVDLLMAGFPCQSFSIGGRKRGFDDVRGQAMFEMFRLIRDWGDDRPSVVVLENVPNFRSGADGEWMGALANEFRRSGYWFATQRHAKVVNTHEVTGIPQDRSRLFMVGCSTANYTGNRFRFPTARAQHQSLSDYLDRSRKATEEYYLPAYNRFREMIEFAIADAGTEVDVYQIRRYYARRKGADMCPTLTANMGHGGHNVPFIKDDWGVRKLTADECARLQGFEAEDLFPASVPAGARYHMIGNAVSEPVAQWIAEGVLAAVEIRGGG